MALIEHAIRFCSKAAGHQLEAEIEDRGDPALRVEAHSSQPASLDVRDHRPADASSVGEILLAPPPPMPQATYKPAELGVVHGATFEGTASIPVCQRLIR